ncbi:MAG: YciI family protein [Alphaproteobacteria bacterium]
MEWMIKCVSKPDMAATREATLEAHKAHLDKFKSETWYSGPMMVGDGSNANGSFRVVDFPDHGVAKNYIDTDPYTTAEIFRRIDIEPLRPWTDVRQRDYAQTEGRAQFVVIARTDPQSSDHVSNDVSSFLAKYRARVVFAGALLDGTRDAVTGALYVVDMDDRAGADALLADEPLSRGPEGRSLTIERWRFGHV